MRLGDAGVLPFGAPRRFVPAGDNRDHRKLLPVIQRRVHGNGETAAQEEVGLRVPIEDLHELEPGCPILEFDPMVLPIGERADPEEHGVPLKTWVAIKRLRAGVA